MKFALYNIIQGNNCSAVKKEVIKGPPRGRSVMRRVMFCAYKLLGLLGQ